MSRRLLALEEAMNLIRQHYAPKQIGIEKVQLEFAYGRVLADDIISPINVPPFDRSTVDGYAVQASSTFGAEEDNPVTLSLLGRISAGQVSQVVVKPKTTIGIATGAPLPAGADAVVMLEYTSVSADKVKIYRPATPGENVLHAGFDVKAKEVVLKKAQHLGSRELGVLAAIGMPAVNVYKKLKVSILSTGGELVKPGKPLEPGKIYDINQSALVASVIECNCEPIPLGIVPDDPKGMKSALKKALRAADVVITSGATSAGAEDIIPQLLNELGKPGVIVWGLATKPGKPTTVAVVNGKPVFALPGHPTSALTIFLLLVRPFLLQAACLQPKQPMIIRARIGAKVFSAAGRTTFIPVKIISTGEGENIAQPIPPESGAITTLASADGFVIVPPSVQFIEQGEMVEVNLLSTWIR